MIVNLTPHAITIVSPDGGKTVIDPSGEIARVTETHTPAGTVDGVPIVTVTYGEVTGLPAGDGECAYIVSALVAAALPHRSDLLVPVGQIRDEAGRIAGCTGLSSGRTKD